MGRFMQLLHFARIDSRKIIRIDTCNKRRILVFFDIIYCFLKYRVRSNQYVSYGFYEKDKMERDGLGREIGEKNIAQDRWLKKWYKERRFITKYSNIKYDASFSLRRRREMAYRRRYNIGECIDIQYNVDISKSHYIDGTISIGNNCFIGKNVAIDYTGTVVIKDNVRITNGAIIETHAHKYHSDYLAKPEVIPSCLVIEDGVMIGCRAVVLPSCNYIGKFSRIAAGAIVTKDVPDFAIVAGVPARVIKMQNDKS